MTFCRFVRNSRGRARRRQFRNMLISSLVAAYSSHWLCNVSRSTNMIFDYKFKRATMKSEVYVEFNLNQIHYTAFHLFIITIITEIKFQIYEGVLLVKCRSRCPHGLRRGSTAACLLGLRFRIPPGALMSVSCECRVLSGRSLCDGPITRPEESYRV